MQPNIRVKRYATRSKHLRRKPRRRGSIATAVLVVLIVVVAGLSVVVALAPPKKQSPELGAKGESTAAEKGAAVEDQDQTAVGETTAAARLTTEATPTGTRKPLSITTMTADPPIVTPSALPNPGGDADLSPSTTLTLDMSEAATITVRVLDARGMTIRKLFSGALGQGSESFEWDGTYPSGDQVPCGDYAVRAQVVSSETTTERGAYVDTKVQAFSYITRGPRTRKAVALTIDDGWNPDMRIVKYLRENKVPATAFLIGGRGVVDAHPEFVQALMRAGCEVANHTDDHEWLTKLTPKQVRADIARAQARIVKITGRSNPWVRPSGGALSTSVIRAARKAGYYFVQWSIDSGDARGGATDESVAQTLNSVQNGSIILTHFGGDGTYDYIRQIVPALRRRGLRFVTVSDLLSGTSIDQETDIPPARPLLRSLAAPGYAPLGPLR